MTVTPKKKKKAQKRGSIADEAVALAKEQVQQELDHFKGAGAILKYNVWPGLKKITRGISGFFLLPFIAVGGALTGIPATEVNNLISGLNTAEGYKGVWKRFKSLTKVYFEQWKHLSWGGRLLEMGKRILLIPANFVWGGLSATFNSLVANVLGGVFTLFGGIYLLKQRLQQSKIFNNASKFIPFFDKLDLLKHADDLVKAANSTANFWGVIASKIAKWDIVKKIASPETLKLWEAAGNPLVLAILEGDKNAILGDKDAILKHAQKYMSPDLAKKWNSASKKFESLQKLIMQGDKDQIHEAVQKFIPGFKSIPTSMQKWVSTFKAKADELGFAKKDFTAVRFDFAKAMGLDKRAAAALKSKLNLHDTTFQTIQARGANMVEVAQSFVSGIENPALKKMMGYTLSAGSPQEALESLVSQHPSPDFIDKIHTFNIVDESGKITRMPRKELEGFKAQLRSTLEAAEERGPIMHI